MFEESKGSNSSSNRPEHTRRQARRQATTTAMEVAPSCRISLRDPEAVAAAPADFSLLAGGCYSFMPSCSFLHCCHCHSCCRSTCPRSRHVPLSLLQSGFMFSAIGTGRCGAGGGGTVAPACQRQWRNAINVISKAKVELSPTQRRRFLANPSSHC